MRVKTRVRSTPPRSRTSSAALRMCAASGESPASRSATYASTVVDRSRGAGVEGRPASVLALLRADPACGRVLLLGREDAEEVADEEILGVDRHVRLQFALPPAVRVLERRAGAGCRARARAGRRRDAGTR